MGKKRQDVSSTRWSKRQMLVYKTVYKETVAGPLHKHIVVYKSPSIYDKRFSHRLTLTDTSYLCVGLGCRNTHQLEKRQAVIQNRAGYNRTSISSLGKYRIYQ